MGPMFSALIIASVLLVLWALAFIVARAFQSIAVAFRISILLVAGVVVGVGFSAVILTLAFGRGSTLTSASQVVGFLSVLACGGLVGGALVLWFSVKLRVLALRSTGRTP